MQSLLQKELKERRELLLKHFQPVEGEFDYAKSSDGTTVEEIGAFLEESVKDGCEGLMVKMLTTTNSTYEPSRRSMNWLKVSWSSDVVVAHWKARNVSAAADAIAQEGLPGRDR